jgi:hypothetical protein
MSDEYRPERAVVIALITALMNDRWSFDQEGRATLRGDDELGDGLVMESLIVELVTLHDPGMAIAILAALATDAMVELGNRGNVDPRILIQEIAPENGEWGKA